MQIATTHYQAANISRALRSFFVVGLAICGAPTVRAQQIQSLEHDPLNAIDNSLVQVDADTYALAYSGGGNDGVIKTFTIAADGSTITEVQSLEHDIDFGIDSSLVQVDADTYALAYTGAGFDGFIKTFTIRGENGTITEVRSLEHDTLHATGNSLVQVDADTYALAYTGAGVDGIIKTFTIAADGSTITEVQSLNHEGGEAVSHSLLQINADTYALAYADDGLDGIIKTFTIAADGSTITQIQSLEHDTLLGSYNSLIQVDADTYALAYSGGSNDGFITTFTIAADGSTITKVQSLEHDTIFAIRHSLVQVDADTYALAYAGVGYDGFIKTFTIAADGSTITEVQSLEHDTENGSSNSLIQVSGDTYALAYAGAGNAGFIKTFTIHGEGSIPVTLMSFVVE